MHTLESSTLVVLSRGGRKILKQANPYIKPANERAFPRCANRGNARFRVATNAETRVSAFVLIAPVAPKRTNAEKRGDALCRIALFVATRVAASIEVRVCALCAFICRLDTRGGLLEDLSSFY